MRQYLALGSLFLAGVLVSAPAEAKPYEVRIALHEGRLRVAEVSAAICGQLHLPPLRLGVGEVKVSGLAGSLFVQSLSAALGDGCRVSVTADALVLHFDPDRLPKSFPQAKRALRTFVATDYPDATARQARHYGLFLPSKLDPARPVVLLIHGLDTGSGMLQPMGDLLRNDGYQIGYFCYPSDQSIADSSAMFTRHMQAMRETFPGLKVDIVAYSMGGLVARDYVESSRYVGGVDRLILVGTPNAGSKWVRFSVVLKAQQQYQLWRQDPEWSPTWAITEGTGEAARDLRPNSNFLRELDSRPRRDGVRYTIIAGDEHPAAEIAGDCVDMITHFIGGQPATWWGFRQCRAGLEHWADDLHQREAKSDGPVKLSSAKLAGVDDCVVLHADHCDLFYRSNGQPPAAWETIEDRLGR